MSLFTTLHVSGAAFVTREVPTSQDGVPGLSWTEWIGYFCLSAALDLAAGAMQLPNIARGMLLGPDSYMRLVRLQDMLAQHAVINAVTRDGSGAGTFLHWSHLLDTFILLVAAPLCLIMDPSHAVHWAGVAVGPLSMGLLGASLAWVLAPLTAPRWRWAAPLMTITSPAVVGYGLAGVVHHHVLIAFFVVVTAGWAIRAAYRARHAGWKTGALAGLGLWLSPETVPFSLLAFGSLGLGWLLHPWDSAYGRTFRDAGCSFLLVCTVAFLCDAPPTGLASVELFRVSAPYVLLAAALCFAGWWTWRLDGCQLASSTRSILGTLGAVAALALWIIAYPAVLDGTAASVASPDAALMLGIITEMQPISTLGDGLALLLGAAAAAATAAFVAVRNRSVGWAYGACCGVLVVILAIGHRRFATYPEIFSAAMLPALVTMATPAFKRHQALWQFLLLGAFLIGPTVAGTLASPAPAVAAATTSHCSLANIGELLAPYDGSVVLADVNDTPELLYRSRVLTVGSLYTNVPAFMRARAAWRSNPSEEVPDAVRATKASLLLFCPAKERSLLVADLPPNTLLDRMNRGEVPSWLSAIGQAADSDYVLYRIGSAAPDNR